jgi:hypothetical protein
MSRSQSTQTFNTASGNAKTDQSNAQSSYGATQGDIQNYRDQLNKFVSSNPYTKGGQFDQTINTGLANTSDAGGASLKGALQSQALRTGQNSAADAATASEYARQNQRQLTADQATAQQQRIGSEADYNKTGLAAATEPISAESNLYGQSTGAANTALNTAAGAAQTPSFFDTLGSSFAGALGKTLGGGNNSAGGGGGGGGSSNVAEHWLFGG